jgi:hypothetical protein
MTAQDIKDGALRWTPSEGLEYRETHISDTLPISFAEVERLNNREVSDLVETALAHPWTWCRLSSSQYDALKQWNEDTP